MFNEFWNSTPAKLDMQDHIQLSFKKSRKKLSWTAQNFFRKSLLPKMEMKSPKKNLPVSSKCIKNSRVRQLLKKSWKISDKYSFYDLIHNFVANEKSLIRWKVFNAQSFREIHLVDAMELFTIKFFYKVALFGTNFGAKSCTAVKTS